MEGERKYQTNKEKFDLHGSAVLIKTGRGTLLFQLKDSRAPSGDADSVTTFGGAIEKHKDRFERNFNSRELTSETSLREMQEELSIPAEYIKSLKPFGYQSFNYEDNPDKGFSVHVAELVPGVTVDDMKLTEGKDIIEGTLEDILKRDDLFEPIREMLERNEERIRRWVEQV